ncbi:hypothetical protein M9H77_08824 [Catharanthus roseus]|uniref:Uncharacterized protein n=1 Tax=Catharanthus roseus TaxID=4058 RepID=A0ACC0BZ37_CATRO|nr:hypothetical protein M9H77_08824 [Catharanthus roseus]
MSPNNVHGVDLHDGEWGAVGSAQYWKYNHDGKKRVTKAIVEAIDDEKKSVTFKVVEGYLLELYKSFRNTVQVDTKGENNLVTWTMEYEKLNENVPEPNTLMDLCLSMTKDIETHHLK